jgi:hypothetical protein
MLVRICALLALMVFLPAPLNAADDDVRSPGRPERQVAMATGVTEAPTIDGDVLGDPAWADVPVLSSFWQTRPDEGQPSSERTEVRIVYTATTLYIAVICFDSEPSRLIVADSRRDADLSETDSFRLIIDTYRDRQNGFIFGTNPAGVEYDAQVSAEGEGSGGGGRRAQAGAGGGLNVNWDGDWTVRTRSGDFGWSAEFAIPFRTLRFAGAGPQTWGINFERTIRRRNEVSYWAPLPRQFGLTRVSLAGDLEGLDLVRPRNLQLSPFVLTQGAHSSGGGLPAATQRPELSLGGDLKYGLSAGLTLDATYNTDFAQVEADEQQVNLDRFNLFFPEKRPFFLENAGIFAVGQSGEVDLFFSRRIGIGPGGMAVPIVGGLRISGDVGGTRLGLLNMQTAQVGVGGLPTNNFAVARVRRELPGRSAIGAIVTNRQGLGEHAVSDDYNRVLALDGQLGLGAHGLLSGFAARSFTPGRDERAHAFRMQSSYNSAGWLLQAGYTEVGEGFNPELGFLRRRAFRRADALVFRRIRPEVLGFQELRPHVSYFTYRGLDGFHETSFLHVDNHWEWRNGIEIHTGVNFTHEGVRQPFTLLSVLAVPTGSYSHREAMLVGMTDRRRWISLRTQAIIGGFFGGSRVSLSPVLAVRAGDAFNAELSVNRNDLSLPSGDATVHLVRARLSYSFTPRIYAQTLLQYNDASDQWSANVRFGWLQAAGTGLFVVFNQATDFGDALVPDLNRRSVIVKYTRLLNMLD